MSFIYYKIKNEDKEKLKEIFEITNIDYEITKCVFDFFYEDEVRASLKEYIKENNIRMKKTVFESIIQNILISFPYDIYGDPIEQFYEYIDEIVLKYMNDLSNK